MLETRELGSVNEHEIITDLKLSGVGIVLSKTYDTIVILGFERDSNYVGIIKGPNLNSQEKILVVTND